MLWDQKGVPHKGWTCIGAIDLGAELENLDADSRKDYYEQCQMCSREGIRYVHIMQHPEYPDELRVGQNCAERMEEDYVNPKRRETSLKNKHKRRMNFMRKEWRRNRDGSFTLTYKGYNLTIKKSRFNERDFGVYIGLRSIWEYNGKKIKSIEVARLIAFELLDEKFN